MLSIDADEQVPEALQAEIHQLLVLADEAPAGLQDSSALLLLWPAGCATVAGGPTMWHGCSVAARRASAMIWSMNDCCTCHRRGRLENPLTHQSFDNLEQVLEKVNRLLQRQRRADACNRASGVGSARHCCVVSGASCAVISCAPAFSMAARG